MSFENLMDHFAYIERFGHWKWLKIPFLGAGASEIGALYAQIDWAHVFPAIGIAITAIGAAVLGLWRNYQLSKIEIEFKRRELERLGATLVVSPNAPTPMTVPIPVSNPPPVEPKP